MIKLLKTVNLQRKNLRILYISKRKNKSFIDITRINNMRTSIGWRQREEKRIFEDAKDLVKEMTSRQLCPFREIMSQLKTASFRFYFDPVNSILLLRENGEDMSRLSIQQSSPLSCRIHLFQFWPRRLRHSACDYNLHHELLTQHVIKFLCVANVYVLSTLKLINTTK